MHSNTDNDGILLVIESYFAGATATTKGIEERFRLTYRHIHKLLDKWLDYIRCLFRCNPAQRLLDTRDLSQFGEFFVV